MSFKHLILFLFMGLYSSIAASNLDSLIYELNSEENDSLRCNHNLELSRHFQGSDVPKSMEYAKAGLKLAQKNNYSEFQMKFLLFLGFVNFDHGNLKEGQLYYGQLKNLTESNNNKKFLAHAINGLGLINWKLENNDLAIKQFQVVYDLAEEIGNQRLFKYAVNNIGLINADQDRNEVALEYFNDLLKVSTERKDKDGLYLAHINIANVQTKTGDYAKAELGLNKCLELLDPDTDHVRIASTYIHFGDLYLEQKNYIKSLEHAGKALEISDHFSIQDYRIVCYRQKAEIYLGLKKYSAAITWAEKGIQLSKDLELDTPDHFFYKILSDSFEQEGRFKEALFSSKKYQSIEDSIFSLEKEKEFAALEVSFNTKQKEAQNELLLKDKASQESSLKGKSKAIAMISAMMILLMIVVVQQLVAKSKSKRVNTYLEKEIASRTEELNHSNKELMQSNDELKRFAFIASHDLKEPIRNIGGFISLIKRRGEGLSKEAFNEYFDYIEKSNYQLIDLVDSILNYSKLDAVNEIEKEAIDLSEVVENAKSILSCTINDRKVEINADDLPVIAHYPDILKIVLKNLIENGIKYNESETPIIKISTEEQDGTVQLFISDNGIGIDPVYHEKVFEMFSRLNNRKEYTGSGMGLAFCKKILQKSGDDIKVHNSTSEGRGSTFVLTLNTIVVKNKTSELSEEMV